MNTSSENKGDIVMENSIFVPMSYEEMMEIDGGGFWKELKAFLLFTATAIATAATGGIVKELLFCTGVGECIHATVTIK